MSLLEAAAIIATICFLLLVSGCSTQVGQMTMLSTQHVRNIDYDYQEGKNQVKGTSCVHYFLFIPLGSFDRRLDKAIENVFHRAGKKGFTGDLLVNPRIYERRWTAVLYSQDCLSVTGNVVRVKS